MFLPNTHTPMVTAITEGIRVSVTTEYQYEYSSPSDNHFVFTYRIRIENDSDYMVQLLRRHWFIYDSIGTHKEVEGEGVVGKQPFIAPQEVYEYVSGCNLSSDMGKLHGVYTMHRLIDDSEIEVEIPEFTLITPYKLN